MICVNIEKLEKLRGDMSEQVFADKLGISRSALWRIRKGMVSPEAKTIEKILDLAGETSIDAYFFTNKCATNATFFGERTE